MQTSKIVAFSTLTATAAAALLFVARSASAGRSLVVVAPPSDEQLAAACATLMPPSSPVASVGVPAAVGLLATALAGARPTYTEQDGVRGVELAVFALPAEALLVFRPYDVLEDQIASLRLPTIPTSGYLDHVVGTATQRYELRLVAAGTLVAAIPTTELAPSPAGHRFEAHVWGEDPNGPLEFLSSQVDLVLP